MHFKAIWAFIAGESRLAPLGVVIAVLTAVVLRQSVPGGGDAVAGIAFVAIIAAALVLGVLEKV